MYLPLYPGRIQFQQWKRESYVAREWLIRVDRIGWVAEGTDFARSRPKCIGLDLEAFLLGANRSIPSFLKQ